METNDRMRAEIFKVIKNQIKSNTPPETKATYERLIEMGYDDFQTKQLIGQCFGLELFDIMKLSKPFDEARYVKNLKNLPKEPTD